MISINKNEFNQMKKTGKVFTIYTSFQADEITPINIFYNIKGKNRFLLESAILKQGGGRYSYIGVEPYMKIYSRGREVTVEKASKTEIVNDDVLNVVKKYVDVDYMETEEDTSFVGGAVGYLGYDAVRNFERIPDKNEDVIGVPESFYNIYKLLICYDHLKHIVKVTYNVFPEDDTAYEEIESTLENISTNIRIPENYHPIEEKKEKSICKSNYSKEEFEKMVDKAKEYIRKGDIFQVVLSQRFEITSDQDPLQVYRKLKSRNPSPYLFYIEFDGFTVVGASPESLVKVYGREVATNPIAGSRPRGKDDAEDKKLKKELLQDKKEIAEHVMLLDLGRNDIGKVSKFGTVKVKRFMDVDFYSHIMHIVSTVTGELKDGLDCFNALRSCFPAGTVSGAPKIRAMEIIDELENTRRGIYAGAVGFFSFNGNMDKCIAIRTAVFKDGKAYVQGGGGIVFDSVPETEYVESMNKTGILREVI
ncbi:anthranilate synthase component I [Clostridium oryzae]|uniref:Anthranilate synthase component 1 n=1 Tax=Clostridium oryzae TaxID=1450648 RepID=A0A1V4IXV1_9CLOT|nr:anthranilate synthase component I [Clostridium oryzae]OPJ64888.1 anthranilate synthase component 1 [Clostridium oryzae]